jgi:hypothetical protein
MSGHGTKFPRKKEQAIAALLSQRTIKGAAPVVGIGEKTLKRWLKDPEFQAEYRKARLEVVHQAIALLQQNSPAAGMTVLKIMADPKARDETRLKAAKIDLDISLNGIALEDIEERISELERDAKNRKKGG